MVRAGQWQTKVGVRGDARWLAPVSTVAPDQLETVLRGVADG